MIQIRCVLMVGWLLIILPLMVNAQEKQDAVVDINKTILMSIQEFNKQQGVLKQEQDILSKQIKSEVNKVDQSRLVLDEHKKVLEVLNQQLDSVVAKNKQLTEQFNSMLEGSRKKVLDVLQEKKGS